MQGYSDRLYDALGLVQDVAVPESKDAIILRSQKLIAICIVWRTVEVLASVEFDDDSRFNTDEVADVGADHVLAPELEAIDLTTAKPAPEEAFGVRQVLAQIRAKLSMGRKQHVKMAQI